MDSSGDAPSTSQQPSETTRCTEQSLPVDTSPQENAGLSLRPGVQSRNEQAEQAQQYSHAVHDVPKADIDQQHSPLALTVDPSRIERQITDKEETHEADNDDDDEEYYGDESEDSVELKDRRYKTVQLTHRTERVRDKELEQREAEDHAAAHKPT